MADTTLSKIASVLYELRGPMQSLFPTKNFLLSAWAGKGSDGSAGSGVEVPTHLYDGSGVRIPVDTAQMQGGGWIAEGGTVNVPIAPTLTYATVTLKKFIQPFGISLEAMEDSKGANSAIDATALNLQKARLAMAEQVNVAMCGAGTGLLGTLASHSNLISTMASGTEWDKFYVGQVVDVLTRSDGTDAGQGKRRLISAIDISAGTITFSTTSQASDGGSGNITASSSSGIYVAGSYGNVLAGGIRAAVGATSFQGITLATYPQFKPVDGRAGTTTTQPFSDSMIDLGVTLGQRAGDAEYDFGVGDPNSINVYKNAKANQWRTNVPTGTVSGRFTGVQIDLGNQVVSLVPERKFNPGSVHFVAKSAATMYASKSAPDYDDESGSMFKQFNRTTNYEVWLKWRPEWGWHNPSKMLYFDNLSTQSSAG